MQSLSSTRASARARRASASQPVRVLARAGLGARGVIYVLIGWVAILVALGKTTQEADQRGALQLLSGKPYGLISLWLLVYWLRRLRAVAAERGRLRRHSRRERASPRLKSLARAAAYGFLAVTTFSVISGAKRSESGQEEDYSAADESSRRPVGCGPGRGNHHRGRRGPGDAGSEAQVHEIPADRADQPADAARCRPDRT